MLADVTISNGLDWTVDGATMYFIDTPTRQVDRFSFEPSTGSIADRKRAVSIRPGAGNPDGMTLDAEDHLWVALWDGWAVERYASDGNLELRVDVPAAQASSRTFGGSDLDLLFITTAQKEFPVGGKPDQPHAGGLFVCRPGVRGLAHRSRADRPVAMRLTLGHVEGFDQTIATFAQQLGLTSIQFHTPSDLAGRSGHWELDELTDLRERCEAAGLIVEGIENVPFRHWDKVLLGEPGREQQLENYRTTIRNMARASITMLGHHFMPTYVWRTDLRARGRGGAVVTAFDADRTAQGNALAGYKLAPDRPLPGPIDAEQMWDNYRVFLEAVLPVAEEVGVRLAVHPDDPPVAAGLGGIARILSSPEGLARAEELSGGSPAWGLDLCLGTVSEMAGRHSVERSSTRSDRPARSSTSTSGTCRASRHGSRNRSLGKGTSTRRPCSDDSVVWASTGSSSTTTSPR